MFNLHFSIERWKWNPEFGLWVSNKGHFKNKDKKPVPIQIGEGGYPAVYCGGTTHKHRFAHRVVMLTWRPTANAEHLTVDHLDHNKRNFSLDNLEWVSFAENQRRADADLVNITVEGNAELVEKVDVSITTTQAAPTKYNYRVRLRGGAILTVEQIAEAFYPVYHKTPQNVGLVCENVQDFEKYIHNITSGAKKKFLGFEFKRIKKESNYDACTET